MMDCLFSVLWFGQREKVPGRVFFFEGNVGVGKTDCMNAVAEILREKGVSVACVEENVEEWRKDGLLGQKYEGDESVFSAYGLLKDYLNRHSRVMEAKKTHDVVLVERHPTTTLKVFGTDARTKTLFDTVGGLVPGFLTPVPENTIYVKNSPRTCFERVKRRARPEERDLDEFAFETWSAAHEDMMKEREAMGGTVNTLDAFGADAHQLSPSIVTCMGYDPVGKKPPS